MDGVVGLVIPPARASGVPAGLGTRIAAMRDSFVTGTLPVPSVAFVPEGVPVARR
jgi:hypothetical protein